MAFLYFKYILFTILISYEENLNVQINNFAHFLFFDLP